MEHRVVGSVIVAVGALMVVAGLVVLLGIAPSFRSLSSGEEWTQRYEGRIRTYIDLASLESLSGRRLTVQRTVKVQQTAGSAALVRDETVMRTPEGRLLRTVEHCALDRRTMEGTSDGLSSWEDTTGYWTRRGLVCGWPFDVRQGDYWIWVDAYRRAVPVRFVGVVEHADSGETAYRFAASGSQEAVTEEEVDYLGLPTIVPKTLLLALSDSGQMNPVLSRLLPDVLAAWPGPSLPVEYTWEFHTQYWVEPRTGVLLDMRTRQILRVGLADEVSIATPLATLPATQRNALQITVQDMEYEASAATIAASAQSIEHQLRPLSLYGTTLPTALVVAGLIVGTAGSLLVNWRRYR